MMQSNFPEFAQFIKLHKELLERLFPSNWFDTPKNDHPAYTQWHFCKTILDQGGVLQFPEQEDQLFELSQILVNSGIIATVSGGDVQQLKFGSLDLFGDESVQKMIAKVTPIVKTTN